MTVGEKIRHLRGVEGSLRGFGRPMTQTEVIRAMRRELRKAISQAYLSQIESGARPHMTHATRDLLARFFKVHPGFLVDDAEGFQTGLASELRVQDAKVDSWLYSAAENSANDPELSRALKDVADYDDSRKCLLLLGQIVRMPGLVDHLAEVLGAGAEPEASREGTARTSGAGQSTTELGGA
jgi:transcriptional regulator with XRE-family HTH domain